MTTETPIDLGPNYGFQTLLGFRKTAHEPDFARLELDLRPELGNLMGIPHGGVHAAMLDAALGSAACFTGPGQPPRMAVTLNLNVSYMATPRGTRLIAEGRRVGGGKRIYFSEGVIRDDTGLVLARATGTFRFVD
jgi:uncharacterized protein (TIGR00369 family)